jgi:hypothetical protein
MQVQRHRPVPIETAFAGKRVPSLPRRQTDLLEQERQGEREAVVDRRVLDIGE